MTNERLINKMSLEQKVKLITSVKLYKSSPSGNYEFPVFELERRPLSDCDVFSTQFPSDAALAGSWNLSLVSEVYRNLGVEIRAHESYAVFNVAGDCKGDDDFKSPYFSGRFAASKINGLNACGQYSAFEEFSFDEGIEEQRARLLRDIVFAESSPYFALFKTPKGAEERVQIYKYKGLSLGVAADSKQAAAYISGGCTLVFLTDDFTAQLVSHLTELTQNYKISHSDYVSGRIKLKEFDRRCREGEILDEGIIDRACDTLVSLLIDMKKKGEEANIGLSSINPNHTAKFDEITHDQAALDAARESIVLLKNEGVLPLGHSVKVAVIGGAAKDESYQTEFFAQRATNTVTAFEEINNYDLTAVGYAEGYERGAAGRYDLTAVAAELCSSADVALVYLCAGRNERTLPQGQTELVSALFERGVKIIAVVAADGEFDFSFADNCAAVLYTNRGGQAVTRAALDILTGKVNPSAHLVFAAYDGGNSENVRYPFGYGLSYTKFEYRNLGLTPRGISCTVTNTGGCDGCAVVQLYVKKEGANSMFAEKTLRGFSKVFIKNGESVRVELPFDENTFRYYDAKGGFYRIDGGNYAIYAGENIDDEKLTGSITLSAHEYREKFTNEIEEQTDGREVKFNPSLYPKEVEKAKKQLSAGLKIFVALIIALYYNGILAAFAFTDIFPDKDIIFYCIIGGLALVADVLIAAYIAVNAKKRRAQKYIAVNETFTDMVKHVDEFDEIAKTTYADAKIEPEEEEIAEQPAREQQTQVKPNSYELNFDDGEEGGEISEKFSFGALCADFCNCCLSRGVAVEQSSVRALAAALSTGRIIFLSSKNTEIFPEFLQAFNAYFSNHPVTSVPENPDNESSVLWRQDGDKFVTSDFANAIYSAVKSPEKLCVAVLDGVRTQNILTYFAPFIEYAAHPTEEHFINLNGDTSLRLPENIRYVLAPEGEITLPREIADCSLQTEVIISRADAPDGQEAEIKNISFAALEEAISLSRENNFLPEKVWKKLDELVEAVNSSERFVLGNKNTLQLEAFTSVLLECGGDESETLTYLFTSKIVPVLKTTKTYNKDGGEKTLFGYIEKLFPDGELAAVQKSLSKKI